MAIFKSGFSLNPIATKVERLTYLQLLVMAPNMHGNVTERTDAQKRFAGMPYALLLTEKEKEST